MDMGHPPHRGAHTLDAGKPATRDMGMSTMTEPIPPAVDRDTAATFLGTLFDAPKTIAGRAHRRGRMVARLRLHLRSPRLCLGRWATYEETAARTMGIVETVGT
jgi:hypothetical protein